MALNYSHHVGATELRSHVTVSKQYHGSLEVSNRTFPLAPEFFIVQLSTMAIVILIASAVFIWGPMLLFRSFLGGWEMVTILAGMLYVTLVTLYSIYLGFWMNKYTFKFYTDYIDVCTGVFRVRERRASYGAIQKVRIYQGMFERMGNVAHIRIESPAAINVHDRDLSVPVTIVGLSISSAYKVAEIIRECAKLK